MAGVTIEVDSRNFGEQVSRSSVPVLVDFWAEWCGPCHRIAPVVEELASAYQGRMQVAKVNVDENSDLAGNYGVLSIPTLLLFKEGEPVERVVGVQSKEDLEKQLAPHLA